MHLYIRPQTIPVPTPHTKHSGTYPTHKAYRYLPHTQSIPVPILPHTQSIPVPTLPHTQSVPVPILPHKRNVPVPIQPHTQSVPVPTVYQARLDFYTFINILS
jgi:hypothetical protein